MPERYIPAFRANLPTFEVLVDTPPTQVEILVAAFSYQLIEKHIELDAIQDLKAMPNALCKGVLKFNLSVRWPKSYSKFGIMTIRCYPFYTRVGNTEPTMLITGKLQARDVVDKVTTFRFEFEATDETIWLYGFQAVVKQGCDTLLELILRDTF